MDFSDKAKEIREGEELDEKRIEAFLKDAVRGLSGACTIRQFPRGFSNLTYLVVVGGREMVLRRPPIGANIKSAHDMGREYRILSALRPVFPYCPRPLVYTEDASIIGAPFYVMERIPGVILRKNLPKGLSYTPARARALCERLLDVHVELHSIDVKKVGLDNLGKPGGYVKRQVEGWSGRYRKARTPDAPDFEAIMAHLARNMPPDADRPTIVHNDYRFDNVVLDANDPMKIVGVLDWEMATHGDPLMDLGNTLAYWIEKDDPEEVQLMRLMPTNMEGALTRKEIIERYARKTGRDLGDFDFYYCFGLFRLAVIAQQIYNRYYHGITRDERFAFLGVGVHLLEKTALKVMEVI
ncbi:MAG: phosphotransferase family protein [Desulfobacterales bacterium]|nr:phosphotransferase family protein [Desulfobacterales bacterium]